MYLIQVMRTKHNNRYCYFLATIWKMGFPLLIRHIKNGNEKNP